MLDTTIAGDISYLVPAADRTIGFLLRLHGEFAQPEIDFMVDCAGDTGTLIDVGANFGPISLPFARRRPGWRVLAIEAHRGLAGLLAANAFNNRLFNVEAIPAAAGREAALHTFPAIPLSADMRFGLMSFDLEGPREQVRMLRLDDIATPDTLLVKVDVEGFEPEVVAGAPRLIESQTAIWIIEAVGTRAEARTAINQLFRDAGYQLYWFYAPFVTPLAPKAKAGSVAAGDVNVVAVPPGRSIPWPLKAVEDCGEAAPTGLEGYEYLRRYGYVDTARPGPA